jgi:hypothetical protein
VRLTVEVSEDRRAPEFKEVLWHPPVLMVLGAWVACDDPGNIVVSVLF